METILEKDQYNLLWRSSWCSFASAAYGTYRQQYDISIAEFAVFLSSINFWRYPLNDWRKYLDILVVQCALYVHLLRAYNTQYSIQYYSIMFVAFLFYGGGEYFYRKKQYVISTYSHMMLHILANLANIVLHSGKI